MKDESKTVVNLSAFNANNIDQEQFDQSGPLNLESEIDDALKGVLDAHELYCRLHLCPPIYAMSKIEDVDGQEVTMEDILNLAATLDVPFEAEEGWWWTSSVKVIQSLLDEGDYCTASKVYTLSGSPYMAFAMIHWDGIIWVDVDFSVNDYSLGVVSPKLLSDYLHVNIDYGYEGYGELDNEDHSQAVGSHYFVSIADQPFYHPLRMDIADNTTVDFLKAIDTGPLLEAIQGHHPLLTALNPQYVKTVEDNLANQ